MTREEAANILSNDIIDGHVEGNARFMDAFWFAVDNLKAEPCEDAVSKAIKTIANYCSERTCRNCHLFSSEGCIFKCGYPHEWLEVQEELKGESE